MNRAWKLSENEMTIYASINAEELGSVLAMSKEEVDTVYVSAKTVLLVCRVLFFFVTTMISML